MSYTGAAAGHHHKHASVNEPGCLLGNDSFRKGDVMAAFCVFPLGAAGYVLRYSRGIRATMYFNELALIGQFLQIAAYGIFRNIHIF